MNQSSSAATDPGSRSRLTLAAFLIGLPLATTILGAILPPGAPLHDTIAYRYVSHTVESVEVVLFCCALGALGYKLWRSRAEHAACRAAVLPAWDGTPVPVTEAGRLLGLLDQVPAKVRNTYLVRRAAAVLDFLCRRRSAAELDDQLRTLADNDALALEGSYALTRFITWAIPILGFLGTVLGITGAIAGVTPEKLEKDLSLVTDGLSLAFDATALALGLTMITMFVSFLVERREQGFLEAVDHFVDRHLAHRFERGGVDAGPFVEIVGRNTRALLDGTEQLVKRQADVWARALAEIERQTAESHARQQDRLTTALETALERTLQSFALRMAALEKQGVEHSARLFEQCAHLANAVRDTGREQQAVLVRVADGLAAQAAALGELQKGEKNLLELQAALRQNLKVLTESGAFEQAVHSLTAAIHLLTARAAVQPPGEGSRLPPGKAA